MSKRRLITSALPYVNNEPHLGNIIGCVLSADVFARYSRLKDIETLYICGTDEYGTATETKAQEESLSPKEICDKYHTIHKKIYEFFNISFDAFGRTSSKTHTEVVHEIFDYVNKEDYILKKTTKQYFSLKLDKFLADRYIIGTCPKCQYEKARGDQCDKCSSMLNPNELKNPRSALDSSKLTLKETNHLYFNLPKLTKELSKWQQKSQEEGVWATNAFNFSQSWLKQGLEARAITRDLKWGIPIPQKGYENKVFYVWFDATIGYISITKHFFPK